MKKRYHSIVFDLDGTLIDSAGDINVCLKSAAGELSLPARERSYLGLPLGDIFRSAIPGIDDKSLAAMCTKFRELYDFSDYPLTKLMPEVENVLRSLSSDGMRMFIATNKPIKPTLRIMAKLNIAERFTDVASPDVLPGRKMSKAEMLGFLIDKWRLDQRTTLMVGDSEQDVSASKQNSISSAYLTSGYGVTPKAELLRPDFMLRSMSCLKGAVYKA